MYTISDRILIIGMHFPCAHAILSSSFPFYYYIHLCIYVHSTIILGHFDGMVLKFYSIIFLYIVCCIFSCYYLYFMFYSYNFLYISFNSFSLYFSFSYQSGDQNEFSYFSFRFSENSTTTVFPSNAHRYIPLNHLNQNSK